MRLIVPVNPAAFQASFTAPDVALGMVVEELLHEARLARSVRAGLIAFGAGFFLADSLTLGAAFFLAGLDFLGAGVFLAGLLVFAD